MSLFARTWRYTHRPYAIRFLKFNDQAAIIIQIESELGAQNLDAILAAVGDQIDAVWMGTLDMRVTMGLDDLWGDEPAFPGRREALRGYFEKA